MNFFKIAKKSLGQNFLIDQNIINKIIKIGSIKKDSNILEIGPGYGNLTEKILNMNPNSLLAIEKDNIRDIKVAEKTFSMYFISSLFFFSCLNNQKDNNSRTR